MFICHHNSLCVLLLSPSQGLCCGQDCKFKPVGQACDDETDCQKEVVCSGHSPFCPEPSAKENLTVCSQGTRVCLNGVRQPHLPHHCVTQLRCPTSQSVQVCSDVANLVLEKKLSVSSFRVYSWPHYKVHLVAVRRLSILSHDPYHQMTFAQLSINYRGSNFWEAHSTDIHSFHSFLNEHNFRVRKLQIKL